MYECRAKRIDTIELYMYITITRDIKIGARHISSDQMRQIYRFYELHDVISFEQSFFFVGKVFKFIDSKWQELDFQESFKITKIEGQVSISTPNCYVIK